MPGASVTGSLRASGNSVAPPPAGAACGDAPPRALSFPNSILERTCPGNSVSSPVASSPSSAPNNLIVHWNRSYSKMPPERSRPGRSANIIARGRRLTPESLGKTPITNLEKKRPNIRLVTLTTFAI